MRPQLELKDNSQAQKNLRPTQDADDTHRLVLGLVLFLVAVLAAVLLAEGVADGLLGDGTQRRHQRGLVVAHAERLDRLREIKIVHV